MNEGSTARPTVLDTTVLSNFAYLDEVAALRVLTRPVTVPAVRTELVDGVDSYPFLTAATAALSDTIPIVSLDDPTRELSDRLSERPDRGETEAFALAETDDGLLATDDGTARTLARERGVRLTGTIGVLVKRLC